MEGRFLKGRELTGDESRFPDLLVVPTWCRLIETYKQSGTGYGYVRDASSYWRLPGTAQLCIMKQKQVVS